MLIFIMKIIISYIICAFLSFLIFNKLRLGFTDKKGNDIQLEDYQIRTIKIMISIMWIYYLPALAIDFIKRREKGD